MPHVEKKFVSRSIMPANPGFSLVYLWKNEDGSHEALPPDPILGWRVDVFVDPRDASECDTVAWPICMDRISEQRWLIVHPDGQVTDVANAGYQSIDDALADINKPA